MRPRVQDSSWPGESSLVTPTKVGVQLGQLQVKLDSGLRRNDDVGRVLPAHALVMTTLAVLVLDMSSKGGTQFGPPLQEQRSSK